MKVFAVIYVNFMLFASSFAGNLNFPHCCGMSENNLILEECFLKFNPMLGIPSKNLFSGRMSSLLVIAVDRVYIAMAGLAQGGNITRKAIVSSD